MHNPGIKEASWQWPSQTKSAFKTIVTKNQKRLDRMSRAEWEQMNKRLEGFFSDRANHYIATSNDPDAFCEAKAMRDVLNHWSTIKYK